MYDFILLAQEMSPGQASTSNMITGIIGYVGVVGALIWHLWYNTTKTIPDMQTKNDAHVEKITEQHAKAQKEVVDRFTETLAQERRFRELEAQSLQTFLESGKACNYDKTKDKHA